MTAVELVIKEIDQQQKRYIDLAKKDKSIKKEVDAILTATTLLKMKCEQALEMEKQQIIDAYERGDKYKFEPPGTDYYTETFNK
jgi:RNA-binding protein YhbY